MLSKVLRNLLSELLLVLVIVVVANIRVSAQATEIIYIEWIEDPTTTAVINWISAPGTDQSFEYRTQGGNWTVGNASSNSIPGANENRFKGNLTNLEPGTVYEFRVAGESAVHLFRTAPENIKEPISFIIAGDIYTDDTGQDKTDTIEAFRNMAEKAAPYEPYFAALGGDLSHAGSQRRSVGLWFEFLELWYETMVTDQGFIIPMVITIGNNEVPGGFGAIPEDLIFINSLFSFPKDQWGNSAFNHYGVLDFGDYMSLIMLNTNHSNRIEGAQTQWLRTTLLNRRNRDHVYPVYHVAGWPAFRSFRGTHEDAVRNNWHNLFNNNGVRTVFEHHDHIFKKTVALGDCSVPVNTKFDCNLNSKGVVYMGGGSWGSPNNREFNNEWYIDNYSNDHNFVLVEISESFRTFNAIGENGQSITDFTDYLKLPPPQGITAENITTDSFTIKWNQVEGAFRYYIDISEDENFQSYVSGYKNKNVGSNTSLAVSDLAPNRRYYFRIRTESSFDMGEYSEAFEISLKPESPEALIASNVQVTSFSANWNSVPNVSEYIISVSTDSLFSSFLPGFNQKLVENSTSIAVENLEPDTEYFYRVRSVFPPRESDFSSVISVKTVGLDDELTSIQVDIDKVLANSTQKATLTVTVIDENGNPVDGAEIDIIQEGGTSTLSPLNDTFTNSNGIVIYTITSETPGEVQYRAFLSNYEIGDGTSIIFQPFLEEAQIGNNFPNPFNHSTKIPLTIPRQMDVHLSLVSVLGKNVQTILNESRNPGYYEIEINPGGLAAGVYFVRLITEDGVSLNKMTYTK